METIPTTLYETLTPEDKKAVLEQAISDFQLALRTPLQFGAFSRAQSISELTEALHDIVTRAIESAEI